MVNLVIDKRFELHLLVYNFIIIIIFCVEKKVMEKLLDSTQLVSGVAILLSFIAGYRYGIRNLDEQTKSTAQDLSEKNRVKSTISKVVNLLVIT